jgi:predicted O-methyltransferase YrrM
MTVQEIADEVAATQADSTFNYLDYLAQHEPMEVQNSGPEYALEYYRVKETAARIIKPQVIFEIGVRLGYSAAAFLYSNPTATYVGVDSFLEEDCGAGESQQEYVRNFLKERFPEANIQIIRSNTQRAVVKESAIRTWGDRVDLMHVDGDHSYAGCYSDIGLGHAVVKNGGYIMVDDYLNPKMQHSVAASTNDYAAAHGFDQATIESWRGDSLVEVVK